MANAKESDERPDPVELDVCLLALASSYRQILRRLKKLEGRKALPGSLQEAATAYKRASDEFDIDRFRSLIEYEMEHVIGSTEAHYGAELRPAALGTRVLSVGTRLVDGIHASLHGVTFDLSTMQAPCERLRRDAVTTIWE
ncbi:MAG: hypothetical protein OEX04_08325 [Acidimicrobiia bacterium]|nr:hypothetical protein [Acidimicrobiia bacterium]MDH5293133.1 hypothetical protein [Acidimicrobiia bacterium]